MRVGFRCLAVICLLLLSSVSTYGQDRVFYAGGGRHTVFRDVLELSDGTLLVAGGSDDLGWLPQGTSKATLSADAIKSQPGGERVGFVLHLSKDLDRVLHILQLPPGAAEDVRRLRVTSLPGAPTGDLFLSGTTKEDRSASGGYFIARLDGNFVKSTPKRMLWVQNVWAGGAHRDVQPWDVGSDGKVAYITGKEFAADWVSLQRLTPDGKDDVVPNWRYHFGQGKDGPTTGHWTPASARKDVKVEGSAVVFKISRMDLRSWTDAEYKAIEDDGNGKPRQGHWPDDLFFSGPGDPDGKGAPAGGYTGYKPGKNPTHRVVAVVIDRRDNSMYAGFSVQSRLPHGEPDFEPAVITWDAQGTMRWWSRLYTETTQNSTPDQYVDNLAIDYANDRLIVGARCHGNNVMNYWNGTNAFKNGLNGKTGNVHVSWIGALDCKTGKFQNATWLAELTDGSTKLPKPIESGSLAGWPNPNEGWADLNTTRLLDLAVDLTGRIYVAAVGRRPITTTNAYQQMPKPAEGRSAWSNFVRIYERSFGEVSYSTILNAPWDLASGEAGPSPDVLAIAPVADGVIAVGQHHGKDKEAVKPMPTTRPAAWGNSEPSDAGVIARFVTEPPK